MNNFLNFNRNNHLHNLFNNFRALLINYRIAVVVGIL
jgi:hypothetical protein